MSRTGLPFPLAISESLASLPPPPPLCSSPTNIRAPRRKRGYSFRVPSGLRECESPRAKRVEAENDARGKRRNAFWRFHQSRREASDIGTGKQYSSRAKAPKHGARKDTPWKMYIIASRNGMLVSPAVTRAYVS